MKKLKTGVELMRPGSSPNGKPRVFISYRKRDSRYLDMIVKDLINEEYGFDCVVWYDSNLNGGEAFDARIKREMQACDLFVLIVTNRTFEDGCYVVEKEIPAAMDFGLTIVPITVQRISAEVREKMNRILNKAHALDRLNAELYTQQLKRTLDSTLGLHSISDRIKSAMRHRDSISSATVEQCFYMGIGYLKGMHAEKDIAHGTEMIVSAATNGLLEAQKYLADMYLGSVDVERDVTAAKEWAGKALENAKGVYSRNNSFENARQLSEAYKQYGSVLSQEEDDSAELERCYSQALDMWRDFPQLDDIVEARRLYTNTLSLYGAVLFNRSTATGGDYVLAEQVYREMETAARNLRRVRGSDDDHAELADAYAWLGNIQRQRKDYERALEFYERSHAICTEIYRNGSGPYRARRYYAIISYKIAYVHSLHRRFNEVYDYGVQSFDAISKLASEYGTVEAYRNLLNTCELLSEVCKIKNECAQSVTVQRTALETIQNIIASAPSQKDILRPRYERMLTQFVTGMASGECVSRFVRDALRFFTELEEISVGDSYSDYIRLLNSISSLRRDLDLNIADDDSADGTDEPCRAPEPETAAAAPEGRKPGLLSRLFKK